MNRMEIFDQDPINYRTPYLLVAQEPGDLGKSIDIPERAFVSLVVWDAEGIPDETVMEVVGTLLDSGAQYVCTWGTDCERVHDLVDASAFDVAADYDVDPAVMTTWHDDEPLQEAVDFFLTNATPDEAFEGKCTGAVAVVIGSDEYAETVRGVLRFLVS